MKRIAEAFEQIGATNSRIEKEALLRGFAEVPNFKAVLQFIYNPYIRTGIAKAKLLKAQHSISTINVLYPEKFATIKEVLQYFANHGTGSDKDVWLAWFFINKCTSLSAKILAEAIVTKNLKIGVTETTLNKVYGNDFIPKIGIMKGLRYNDCKDKVKGPFIVTKKEDGHRRVLVKENGVSTLYTRSGIIDTGLVDVEAEFQYLPDNMVYDSEFLAIGDFADSIALRQATSSIMNSKGIRRCVTMNIFDMLPVEEFKAGKSKQGALARKIQLAGLFDDMTSLLRLTGLSNAIIPTIEVQLKFIKPVEVMGLATTEAEVLDFAMSMWDIQQEGVMLNTIDGLYEIKRTKELLKVKKVEEHVLKIIGFQEGEGKYAGVLGSILVDYKGQKVGVGSGFTDSERWSFWNRQSSLLGKKVEIDSFGESTDACGNVSLNCPIFKRLAVK